MDWRSLLFLSLVVDCFITGLVESQSVRVVATIDEEVTLRCRTPFGEQAVWYRDEMPLSQSGSGRMITRDSLVISRVMLRDAGRYTCIDPAQTPTQLFARDYSLVVQRRPTISRPPVGLGNVLVGEKVTFSCTSEGSPPPSIVWTISNTGTTILSMRNGSTSFLDVMANSPGMHNITCTINPPMENPPMENPTSKSVTFGALDEPINDNISNLPSSNEFATINVDGLNNVISNNSNPIMFSCLDPPVMTTDIEWTRDGEVIDNDSNNELTVEPETGVYCCSVDGIIVRCAYIFQTRRARISRISPSISTVSGRNISLYCEASGEEPAEITWLYENRTAIVNSSQTIIRGNILESHLTLVNVQAENRVMEIICTARNSHGSDERNVSITTVGSCSSNLITSDNRWIIPNSPNHRMEDILGESVFQIVYGNFNGRSESITHDIPLNSSTEALYFRAQVRQDDDDDEISTIPHVCLTAADVDVSQCATNMLDGHITGWQWVEGVFNFTELGVSRDDLTAMSVQVELYADRTGATRSSGEVFFDNVCVEPMFAAIVGNGSASSDEDDNTTTYIIIGAAGGGGLLLLLLLILIVCCCICCRKKKVKVGRFRKQSLDTIRRFATQSSDTKSSNAVRYHPNPSRQDTLNYGYNYVSPNKPGEMVDENYDAKGGLYLKLDGTQNKQPNQYQSVNATNDATDDAVELYDTIIEPEQPQYEILPCESGKTAQYLAVVADHDKDEDTSETPYLYVLPTPNQEIYSDISDTQLKSEDDQESEIYD